MSEERTPVPGREQLLVVDELFGRVFAMPDGELLIGRSESCDVTIARGSIGEEHAELSWDGAILTVRDLGSTNGTFLLPAGSEDGDGPRQVVGRVRVEPGDRLLMGLGRLVIRPASWLGDQPPGSLPAQPIDDAVVDEVLEAARPGGDLSRFTPEVQSAAWTAAFLRWRRAPGPRHVFEVGARLCDAGTLEALRRGLDDPVRWFLDAGLDVVKMLASSPLPVGPLLALDVRLRHPSRGFREVSGVKVRTVAHKQDLTITDLACRPFLDRADEVPEHLRGDFAANAIESARKQGAAWPAREWRRLLADPAFARAAADVVFFVRERELAFRPVDGEAIGLDGVVEVRDGELVGVLPAVDAAWHQHLADYEVVQVFPQ